MTAVRTETRMSLGVRFVRKGGEVKAPDMVGEARQTIVAVAVGDDKLAALDQVLDDAGFYEVLDSALEAGCKSQSDFRIAIKANFMFAYNRRDCTTFTDPELVHYLVKRLRRKGYREIAVVESRSTYGVYYEHRTVAEVGAYPGYDQSRGFKLVDLTTDCDGERFLGPHLGTHPVPRTWRDADFRISFAKNKTHSYAFYTLTLKNIFGALPLEDKYEEYHIKRDIYGSTIEYLCAFPVGFGLIDAFVSADGPFGIYADRTPKNTRTIIGGEDLVAVDWVGASRMGEDPVVSQYMQKAVERFGKPEIRIIGDESVYQPWSKAPKALTIAMNDGLDSLHMFGNLLFLAGTQLDEKQFPLKRREWWVRGLRWATKWARWKMFVARTRRTPVNPSSRRTRAGPAASPAGRSTGRGDDGLRRVGCHGPPCARTRLGRPPRQGP